MADEIVDFFDPNYKIIGSGLKSKAQKEGIFVHSFHCWIVNPKGNWTVLFQKRGSDKKVFPNCLDITAAGHLKSGESILDGVREIEEELNVRVDSDDLIELGVKIDIGDVGKAKVREFCNTFILINHGSPESYTPSLDEVEGLVEIDLSDGLKLFSGEVDKVKASGMEYDKPSDSWKSVSIDITNDMFIPRVDSYYYKIFIMAERLKNNNRKVSI